MQRRERFLNPSRAAGIVLFVAFVLTFVRAQVDDDGLYYYSFLRRLFGVDTPTFAYQFGSAFWNAPFWLVSQLVAVRANFGRYHAGEVGVTVASVAAVIACMYFGWRILRELELPRGGAVLILTVFGTPLWYYAVVVPSYKHAADALYWTAASWFLLRLMRDPRLRYVVGAGVCLGLSLATRYVNVALLVGVAVMFAPQRRTRQVRWLASTTLVTAAVLYLLPLIRGIPYTRPADLPFNTVGMDGPPLPVNDPSLHLALGGPIRLVSNQIHFDFAAPYKMLFTLHRGLFIWTPLTLLATIGFVLLVRRDAVNRRFLYGIAASSFALLELHMLYGHGLWDGGGSFSTRFLTALFPFYLLGTAELLRRRRVLMTGALLLCTLWSVWIGLVLLNGANTVGGSVVQVVEQYSGPPHDDIGWFAHLMRLRIVHRWSVLRHDLSY